MQVVHAHRVGIVRVAPERVQRVFGPQPAGSGMHAGGRLCVRAPSRACARPARAQGRRAPARRNVRRRGATRRRRARCRSGTSGGDRPSGAARPRGRARGRSPPGRAGAASPSCAARSRCTSARARAPRGARRARERPCRPRASRGNGRRDGAPPRRQRSPAGPAPGRPPAAPTPAGGREPERGARLPRRVPTFGADEITADRVAVAAEVVGLANRHAHEVDESTGRRPRYPQPPMIEVFEHDGVTYAEVIWADVTRGEDARSSRRRSRRSSSACSPTRRATEEPPHYHKSVQRRIDDLQQMFVVQRGVVDVELYTDEGRLLRGRPARGGRRDRADPRRPRDPRDRGHAGAERQAGALPRRRGGQGRGRRRAVA